MAVIKTIRNPINVNSVFEDPVPGSDYLYFQYDAYTKTTLAPLHDIGMIYSTAGTIGTGNSFGYSGLPDQYRIGGILQLNGETTHVRHSTFNTVNTQANNLDFAPFVVMDGVNKPFPVKYFTDGTNNLVISNYNYANPTSGTQTIYNNCFPVTWTKLNTSSKDLYSSGYLTGIYGAGGNFGSTVAGGTGCGGFPVYRNPATNNLVWIAHDYWGDNNQYTSSYSWTPTAIVGAAFAPIFTASANRQAVGVNRNYSNQLVGVSKLDNFTIQLHQSVQYDGVSYFYKYFDTNNTYSTLNSFASQPTAAGSGGVGTYNLSTSTSTAALNFSTSTWWFVFTATNYTSTFSGTATVSGSVLNVVGATTGTLAVGMTITQISANFSTGTTIGSISYPAYTGTTIVSLGQGTNAGGDRTSNFGGYIPKFASKTFTDTSTATTLGFYIPFVDSKGFYNPLYYQWNQSNDIFTRLTDITVVYPTGNSQSSYWTNDTFSSTSLDSQYGMQRVWYNETFVSGGIRYLIFMQLHGAGGVFDNNPLMRTFPTYSVNTSTYKTLTYTGKIEVPATAKNIVWLSDDRTILGIFCHANFYVYTFSSSSGWTQTGNFPYQFNAVGRDNLGRIWAQDTGLGWGRVHLLTLNVPISIVVTPDATSYNFAGTTVSSNLTVNAFSYSGARIATSVKLVIVGGAMTFAGSNLTKTITTSASGDTVVPITITGGGVSNIIASAVVS